MKLKLDDYSRLNKLQKPEGYDLWISGIISDTDDYLKYYNNIKKIEPKPLIYKINTMRTKEEIKDKIKEFENQKQQISDVSKIEGMQDQILILIESIKFLDKNIELLRWVIIE